MTSRTKNRKKCQDKIRGVNLGGWLVLEPWITPTIFEEVNVGRLKGAIVDEYTYNQHVEKLFLKERLERYSNQPTFVISINTYKTKHKIIIVMVQTLE